MVFFSMKNNVRKINRNVSELPSRPRPVETSRVQPTYEEVARRAYEIYQARSADSRGSEVDDWLQAERELRERLENRLGGANR
jgi:hypothetical protein